jgi:predicted pyridoxine 5'-phosphate oxidase superfamily flavin-nucleotide-binding protein
MTERATLTEEMVQLLGRAIEDRSFCLVGTVDSDGWPNIAYRGSVAVYDEHQLSFWSRARKETVANLEGNPRVVVFYHNRPERKIFRFYGTARHVEGEERERVIEVTPQPELDADPGLKGFGTIVRIERILDGQGNQLSP